MAEQMRPQAAHRPLRPGIGASPVQAGLTPREIYAIIRRHLLMIIASTVLGFVVGGVSWYLLSRYYPRFTAQTFIRVLPPVERDPTQIGGAIVQKDLQYGHRLSMASLITRQSTLAELLRRDKVQQTDWFTHSGKTKSERISQAHESLRKRFGASASRDAEFITLSMTCGNKKESATIVNEMVDLFLASQGETKRKEIALRLARLEDNRDRVQRELNDALTAINAVRDTYNLTDIEERQFQHTVTLKLNDLEIEQNELMLEMKELQAIVGTLERQATGPINEQIENQIETDPVMLVLAQQLALQEAELAGRLTKFGENHRVVRETRELLNEIRRRRQIRKAEIAEQTRQANLKNSQDQLVILTQRLEELERMRQEAETKKRDFDLARVQYEQRKTIKDEREERLNEVKHQISKLKIMLESPETPKVQFAGHAPEPLRMSSPRWQVFFPGGIMLGLMIGVGLAFLVELLNDLVRTPHDVARFLHVRLLGVIPDATEDRQAEDVELCHIVRQAPYSIISESYRRLRTNVRLSASPESVKILLVSSGGPAEGKTSVAVNLATTLVAEEKKVLLIDANFRRPSLDSLFPRNHNEINDSDLGKYPENNEVENNAQPVFGLSTMLTGLCGYQQIIRPSGLEGLDVIDSGPIPSNPGELLGAAGMQQLLRRQRDNYDYIIVDSPPVLLVSDSKMLARYVDGTILVFNAGISRRGAAQRTIRELREIDANVVGCVLMAVRALKGGYFREQFKSYQDYQQLQLAHSL